ncbi:DUF1700 domain-containing protein [Massilia sp. GCM10020059]|uniref:DUF1700 domain-containing protein n=1 Tax=Massilia agrisoli TaxID=2892444 RepID=A0ABS8IV37_9BURK|nr:DUF1700 domain-containing protein [Massilia agrisoli]MCC6072497.1 DUF1700 domain-containing protein [Massilia agrisoli]
MGKLEYLDALKRAMAGLPVEAQAKTLAYYEQRFVDGVAAGLSEEEVAKGLDDPKKIAMTLRANTHMRAFEEKKNPANFVRLMVAVLGLAIFNLFMVVPAIVYASLLATLYACGLALYLGGVAVTASGLAGASELVLDGPLKHFVINGRDDDGEPRQAKVTIDAMGVHVDENYRGEAGDVPASVDVDVSEDTNRSERVIRGAESVAERGIKVYTDMDADSRATQTAVGLAMVVGGIVLFLLSLVVTRYTIVGIRRYIDMNLSLLKGA